MTATLKTCCNVTNQRNSVTERMDIIFQFSASNYSAHPTFSQNIMIRAVILTAIIALCAAQVPVAFQLNGTSSASTTLTTIPAGGDTIKCCGQSMQQYGTISATASTISLSTKTTFLSACGFAVAGTVYTLTNVAALSNGTNTYTATYSGDGLTICFYGTNNGPVVTLVIQIDGTGNCPTATTQASCTISGTSSIGVELVTYNINAASTASIFMTIVVVISTVLYLL
jgi:hypothetical protein